ncbi:MULTISPECIES: hypothetical protein [Streptomyces]|nr:MULTISPECIES: hypothetical protein [Streptomyces]
MADREAVAEQDVTGVLGGSLSTLDAGGDRPRARRWPTRTSGTGPRSASTPAPPCRTSARLPSRPGAAGWWWAAGRTPSPTVPAGRRRTYYYPGGVAGGRLVLGGWYSGPWWKTGLVAGAAGAGGMLLADALSDGLPEGFHQHGPDGGPFGGRADSTGSSEQTFRRGQFTWAGSGTGAERNWRTRQPP